MRVLGAGVVFGAWVWPYAQPSLAICVVAACVFAGVSCLPSLRAGVRLATVFLASAALGAGFAADIPAGPEWSGSVSLRGVVATAGQGHAADVLVTQGGPRRAAQAGPEPVLDGALREDDSGRVRVIFPGLPPRMGSQVMLSGTAYWVDPTHLPGEINPSIQAARAGIRTEVRAREVVQLGRDRLVPAFGAATHAGLLTALVVGDASGIPKDEADLLRRTGTWHLVSVSGLHVGMGAVVAWWLAWALTRPLALWVPRPWLRWLCAGAGVAGACFYADLADWAIPARRAAWMAAGACAVVAASRRPHPGRVLGLAALGTVWADPTSVGTVSFQLSFSAMLGMLIVVPRLLAYVPPDQPRMVRWLVEALGASLGATVGTLPVIALYFQALSPLSPVANLWAVPWIGTFATPFAVLAWAVPGVLGQCALAVADAAATIGLWGVAKFDGAVWAPAVGPAGALGIAAAGGVMRRPLLALLLTASLLFGRTHDTRDLVVTFLAVGQGDATLVEWPDGQRWLIDGGPPGDGVLRYLRRRGITSLDAVFLSHGHPDHYGGLLPVLEHLRVRTLVARGLVEGMTLANVENWSSRHGALVDLPTDWDPPNENDRSLILRFGLGQHSFLLPGDAEQPEEAALVSTRCPQLASTVLKLGHHGSRTSTTAPFLACVQPRIAVVLAGFANRYGHPHVSTLQTLFSASFAPELWRTDQHGSVEVRTDGTTLSVRALAAPTRWVLRDSAR